MGKVEATAHVPGTQLIARIAALLRVLAQLPTVAKSPTTTMWSMPKSRK
jgi:hypothetical protein